jgi:hypothetical protein
MEYVEEDQKLNCIQEEERNWEVPYVESVHLH